jgi:molybdate transport system regulatory protein
MLGDKPGWKLKVRVWVERDGEKVLGPGRVELLGLIEKHRSISAAAKEMKMSYRRAWGLVQDMNRAAGEPLVEAAVGGSGGGGAEITVRGKEAIALYHRLLATFGNAANALEKASISARK